METVYMQIIILVSKPRTVIIIIRKPLCNFTSVWHQHHLLQILRTCTLGHVMMCHREVAGMYEFVHITFYFKC